MVNLRIPRMVYKWAAYSVSNPVSHVSMVRRVKVTEDEPVVSAYAIKVSSSELVLKRVLS